jgi:hypothetical protein
MMKSRSRVNFFFATMFVRHTIKVDEPSRVVGGSSHLISIHRHIQSHFTFVRPTSANAATISWGYRIIIAYSALDLLHLHFYSFRCFAGLTPSEHGEHHIGVFVLWVPFTPFVPHCIHVG